MTQSEARTSLEARIASMETLKAQCQKSQYEQIKSSPKRSVRIVIVGDGYTGKTSLLMGFKGQRFNIDHVPTVFETYACQMQLDGESIELGLLDTADQEGYGRLRRLAYPNCDAFVICYAVDSPDSLYNVTAKWKHELASFIAPNIPIILVATKKDLRRGKETNVDNLSCSEKANFLTYEDGMCTAARIGASHFLETSALDDDGVQEVFRRTVRVALEAQKKRHSSKKENKKCCPCGIL